MKKVDKIFDSFVSNNLFRNKAVLQSNYAPENIPHRDEEIESVASILAPSLRGERVSNLFVYGNTGTGKTLMAKALANETEVNFISVKGPELISKYVGESERGVREVFKKAKQASPCILFFDEIDSLVPARGLSGGDSQTTERVISQFLTELDGLEELKGVIILAATNRKELIDSAILRPGRFDLIMDFPVPDEETREEIFKVHTNGKPLAKDINLKLLAQQSEGLTGSDIEAIIREASMMAIREYLNTRSKAKELIINTSYLIEAINSIKNRRTE